MEKLIQTLNKFLGAKSQDEIAAILENHPEILNDESVCLLSGFAALHREQGEKESASILGQLAYLIARAIEVLPGSDESSKVSIRIPCYPIQTRLQWTKDILLALSVRDNRLIATAQKSAQAAGVYEVVALLESYQVQDPKRTKKLAARLHTKFLAMNCAEEAGIVALIGFDVDAKSLDELISSPIDADDTLEKAVNVSRLAAALASNLDNVACGNFYKLAEGTAFFKLGQHHQASQLYESVLRQYRRLMKHRPDLYRHWTAVTLNSLGNVHLELGLFKEAATYLFEALSLRRKLVQVNPKTYEPLLAATLNTLGTVLADLDRLTEAEEMLHQALDLRRRRAILRGQKFDADVAMTLNNLGEVMQDQSQYKKAKEAFDEALSIYNELERQRPGSNRHHVATVLSNLGGLRNESSE